MSKSFVDRRLDYAAQGVQIQFMLIVAKWLFSVFGCNFPSRHERWLIAKEMQQMGLTWQIQSMCRCRREFATAGVNSEWNSSRSLAFCTTGLACCRWIGVLQENAIGIMNFFTGLDLSKSQADSLLNQLADDWQQQHDAIATRTKTRCSSGHDVQEGLLTLIQRQSARCFGNGKQSCCCLKPRFFNTLKRLWSRQVFPVRT